LIRINPQCSKLLCQHHSALVFCFGALVFCFGALVFCFGALVFCFGALALIVDTLCACGNDYAVPVASP
jgi:hypothetical protein